MKVGDKFELGESYVEVTELAPPNATLRFVVIEEQLLVDMKEQTVVLRPADFDDPNAVATRIRSNYKKAADPVCLMPSELVE